MRNFTWLLLVPFLFFSCSKQNDDPGGSTGGTSGRTSPKPPPPPATKVTVTINDTSMNITSLAFQRYGSGMTITASNAVQKVTAEVSHFYQSNPWGMIYQPEVSYFTRADSLADWGPTHTIVISPGDGILYDNFTPMSDSVVTGNFQGTFEGPGTTKGGKPVVVRGNFKLVFKK